MKILAVFHNHNWEKPNLIPALEEFGDVEFYDYTEQFPKTKWHRRAFFNKRRRNKISASLESKYLDAVRQKKYDFIFWYVSGEHLNKDTARRFHESGIPSINLSFDDLDGKFFNKFDGTQHHGVADLCPFFTLNWIFNSPEIEKLYKERGAETIALHMAANPLYYRPLSLEKTIDVVFVGTSNAFRQEIVKKIEGAGVAIAAYGRGWPNGPLSESEIVATYNRAKIVLGIAAFAGKKDNLAMKARDFEVLATRSLYLTQHHPEIAELFIEGQEIEYFRDSGELLQKIDHYLSDPEKREAVAERGYRKVVTNHTWHGRMLKVFERLGIPVLA